METLNEGIDRISEKLIVYLRDKFNDFEIGYTSPLTQLLGGFATKIYQFQLKCVQKELSKPLVLRLFPQSMGTSVSIWESAVQNVLAGEGYQVARAHITCTDMSVLGGAFFIMDFLPGKPLVYAPLETIPVMLGKTHAALHSIDPEPLIKSLGKHGFDKTTYGLNNHFVGLKGRVSKLPWIREVIDWLINNRPPEPKQLAVCHGDFHVLNILEKDGRVTGVLDWTSFHIADPCKDIADTIVMTTIPSKHLASSVLGPEFPSVDWEMISRLYLDEYRSHRLLDDTHIDYYRVNRCVNGLIWGFDGNVGWQHPLVVKDLVAYIHEITDIRIALPV